MCINLITRQMDVYYKFGDPMMAKERAVMVFCYFLCHTLPVFSSHAICVQTSLRSKHYCYISFCFNFVAVLLIS